MTVLVTGASGHLGNLVVRALLDRGVDPATIKAGARSVGSLADLVSAGVVAVEVDYDRPETLTAALADVDSVLLVSGNEVGRRLEQHRAVIEAAVAAQVSRFVYTSLFRASTSSLPLAPEHWETEKLLLASGLPAVILRNNWYLENYAADLARAADSGVLASGTGEGRVASAARRDYAEAAAAVLVEDGHLGQTYELSGEVSWNYSELAAAFAEVLNREVTWVSLDAEDQRAALLAAGLDEGTAGFVAALDAGIAAGDLDGADGTLARLIGRPTTRLAEGLKAQA